MHTLPSAPRERTSLTDLLFTKNPFYLISAACVIHGTSFWFKAGGNPSPWALMGLVGAFIVLLTGTAFAVVKFGKLWDDARSIFVMLFLLFIELALSFDDSFVSSWRDGGVLFGCGWLFAALVFEFLFVSLRIRMRRLFRIPFHLMLALLFLYPLTMVSAIQNSQQATIQWQLFAFNIAVAVTILLLIPAARKGAAYCKENGTQWNWPIFPWAVFAFVVLALAVRSFAMCASLDPAMLQSVMDSRQLQSIFSGYFLVPIVLAVGMLLLEIGRASSMRQLCRAGMMLPVAAMFLALPSFSPSVLQGAFRENLMNAAASPLFVTLIAVNLFYACAALRKFEAAEWYLSWTTLAFVCIGPRTMGLQTTTELQLWPLVVLCSSHLLLGLRRRKIAQVIVGLLFGLPILHRVSCDSFGAELTVAAECHAVVIACLVIGLQRNNQQLLRLSAVGIGVFSALAVFPPLVAVADVPETLRFSYAVTLFVISGALCYVTRLWAFAGSAIVAVACLLSEIGRQAWTTVRHIQGWQGLMFYAAGFFWLIIAVTISLMKSMRHRKSTVPPT